MIVIQGSPSLRSPLLVIGASVALGAVTHNLFWFAVEDSWPRWAAIVLSILVCGALLIGGLRLAYAPLSYDPQAGTARIGRRTVPLSSITRATRSLSAGGAAAYLSYRFTSTEGPSVRVLAAGQPLRGLDEAHRAALIDFVQRVPLQFEGGGVSATRGSLAANMTGSGTKVPVGAALLLEELGATPSSAGAGPESTSGDASAPGGSRDATSLAAVRGDGTERPVIDREEGARLIEAWEQDDLLAVEQVAALPQGPRRLRRLAFWLCFGTVVVAAVLLLVMVLMEASGRDFGAADEDPLVLTMALAMLGGLLTSVLWAVAADGHVGQLRAAARGWQEAADPFARLRGLPEIYHPAWLQPAPGDRWRTIAAFAGGVIGVIFVAVGPVLVFSEPDYLLLGIVLTVLGIGAIILAIRFWIAWRRRKHSDAEEFIRLAGWRAVPPIVQD